MSENNNKVYGLILPKKSGQAKGSKPATAAFNVFGDESDEEERSQKPVAPYGQGKSSSSSKMKRQTQMDIDKALLEDPNVYEYDEIYDEMQAQKPKVGAKEKESSVKERKSKYITGLLKAAEVKKREEERRKERQVQKEREAEGAKFADKESFVTSAYKKKMLEMQAEEEKERQEAAMEALTDVTKQKDMSGFYRYLYRQTTGDQVKPEPPDASGDDQTKPSERIKTEAEDGEVKVKEEPASPPRGTATSRRSPSASSSGSGSSDSDSAEAAPKTVQDKSKFAQRSKTHGSSNFRRKRADSSSDSDPPPPSKYKDRSPGMGKRSLDTRERQRKATASRKSRSRSPARKSLPRSRSRSPAAHPRSGKISDDRRKRKGSRSSSPDREKISPEERVSRSRQEKSGASERERSDGQREAKSRRVGSEREESPASGGEPRTGPDVSNNIEDNLKEMRKQGNDTTTSQGKENSKPNIDPAKKVYPHHNSAEDIKEARKRYLQRKLAREKAKFA